MSPSPTLYSISPSAQAEQLDVADVWTQSGDSPLAAGYTQIKAFDVGGKTYLLCVGGDSTKASVFEATTSDPWLAPVQSNIDLGSKWDIVRPFVLGERTHLMAYEAENGGFAFWPVADDLSTGVPFNFARRREPGITKGFSEVQPVVINSLLWFVGYSYDNGTVNAYSLTVTAHPAAGSPPGTPALLAIPVWVHQWARNWTRFGWFQMGNECFFLKTNDGRLNVNIDHILDDPSQGSVEVGTYLDLEDALDLNIVRSFYMGGGDPYFVTYMTSGKTTFYRIHADCQGWTQQSQMSTVEGATDIVPYRVGDQAFALFY